MFICRPSGNAMKLRTIRKIIYSMMKVRGKIPLVCSSPSVYSSPTSALLTPSSSFQVVVSNELTSEASSSFDDSLIHLQTLFSALRCPILRTTAAKNDRMLAIMFADITKMVRKHDYSTGNLFLFSLCPSVSFIPVTDSQYRSEGSFHG